MRRALTLVAALALASCSNTAPERNDTAPAADISAIAETYAQPLRAFEGEAELSPLAEGAAAAIGLEGAGCRFAYQERKLFITGGGKGILVLDGRPLTVTGKDQRFAGEGVTIEVARADNAQGTADLVITAPQGVTTFSPGTWSCAA